MVGPIVEKFIWFFITLYPVFVSITQFSDFWVMSYGNWKHILGVFNFHNSISNGILVIKYTWKDPLVRVNRNFWSFFFFLFLSSPLFFNCSFFFSFFSSFSLLSIRSSFFFGSSSHNIFGLHLVLSFFFFFSSFTGLYWLGFFFFSLGSMSLGTGGWRKKKKRKKKVKVKAAPSYRYIAHK